MNIFELSRYTAICCVLILTIVMSSWSVSSAAYMQVGEDSLEYVDGEIVVKFSTSQDAASADSIVALHYCDFVFFCLPENRWAKVSCSDTLDLPSICDSLDTDTSIAFSFPNFVPLLFYSPSDDSVSKQWYLHNTGQPNGKPGADISAFEAWDKEMGDSSVILAILDSGIPLSPKTPPLCEACTTRVFSWPDVADSTRFILGGNYTSDSAECDCDRPALPNDTDIGHGTAVASVLAATMDNTFGTAGVIANSKIRIEAIIGSSGIGDFGLAAQEAANNGVRALNVSWGFEVDTLLQWVDSLFEAVVDFLESESVMVVAAVGNYEYVPEVVVPAAFSQWGTLPNHADGYSNVIGVSATDRWDSLYSEPPMWQNSKSNDSLRTWVSAPGEDILVPWRYYDSVGCTTYVAWSWRSGTSLATPQVLGLVGLILSQNPNLSPHSVRQIIKNSADKVWLDTTDANIFVPFSDAVGTFWEDDYRSWHPEYGFGRINCYHALLSQIWDGDIDSNTTWSDTVILWGDVEVDSGVTLTINSGTLIKTVLDTYNRGVSSDRCEIIVRGTLRVNGVADDSVYFTTKYGYEDNFYGIRVLPGGSADIRYAYFEHAYAGVQLSGSAQDTIEHCWFNNLGMYGVKVANDNAVINDNLFTGIDPGYGIFADGADCEIDGDSLWHCQYAVYTQNGSPTIEHVRITDKGNNGITAEAWGPSPVYVHDVTVTGAFVYSLLYASSTNLTIEECNFVSSDDDRTPWGVVASMTDSLKMRDTKVEEFGSEGFYFYLCQGTGWDLGVDDEDPGNNTITSSSEDKWLYMTGNVYTDDIVAQYNYWGDCPPDDELFDTSPMHVEYDSCLEGAPKRAVSDRHEIAGSRPVTFNIAQNYPNPFNPTTIIEYSVPASSQVRLEIYNVLGQKVRTLADQFQVAGRYQVTWDGTNDGKGEVASGIYLYKLTAGTQTMTKKMLMLK